MTDTATRFIGNCQFCEGDFKVVPRKIERVEVDGEIVEQPMDGEMVHHGYKRPGYGYIVGDCPGVGDRPYEVSCAGIKSALGPLRQSIDGLREYLRRLKAGEVTELSELASSGLSIAKFRKSDTEKYAWESRLRQAIWKTESELRLAEQTLARFEQRILAWKPAFIRTIEEERIKREVQKKKREEEVEARRREKMNKRMALDAKKLAMEEKKLALVAEAIEKLRALAAAPDPKANKYKAWQVMHRLHNKVGWQHYQPKDWHIDNALIALGVAHVVNGGYVQYDSV